MEQETCWKFRWFWAWQDEREEAWLAEMSREGWHLLKVRIPCLYNFQKGEPKHYVYRLDFQTSGRKDRNAYLQLFRDAGWEHLGNMSTWEYFRKKARPGEEPEIFTDPESKIQKYERVIAFIVLFLPILLLPLWPDNPGPFGKPLVDRGILGLVLYFVIAVILLLVSIGIIGIYYRIKQLKNSIRK